MLINNNLNIMWATAIIEELARQGADYFCISPGSRSTPITTAVAMNPGAKKILFFDERAAAFHAAGYAKASGRPSVLICTSGTALANYLPGVIEAEADKIPMIILSADRPPELQDTGANQTINQKDIFIPYTRWKHEIPCPDEKIPLNYLLTTIGQAVFRSIAQPAGPVHINCMFRKPLEPTPEEISDEYQKSFQSLFAKGIKYSEYKLPSKTVSCLDSGELLDNIRRAGKGLLIVGKLDNDEEKQAAKDLIEKLKWPVFADILSGVRIDSEHIVKYFDQILLTEIDEKYHPDLVLHLGGKYTSKRLDLFLSKAKPDKYLMAAPNPTRVDPGHIVTHRYDSSVSEFCNRIIIALKTNPDEEFNRFWKSASEKFENEISSICNKEEINEIAVSRSVMTNTPAANGIFLASSMPIRDADMYASNINTQYIAGNRGASGIDGVIASACGYAEGLNKDVTLISGDLSAFHDMNSLYLLNKIKRNVIIVLINNKGGGIFSFLPISEYDIVFEDYFGTPHDLNFELPAKNFNIEYSLCQTYKEFSDAYQKALQSGKPAIIEVRTYRNENYSLHKELQDKIRGILSGGK